MSIKKIVNRGKDSLASDLIYPLVDRLQTYLNRRIIYHYGADYRGADPKSHNLDKENGGLGYGLINYALVRNTKPKRVLCVGSMYGFIPFICALACKDNQSGHVDFVDAGYDVNNQNDAGKHNFGRGFWKTEEAKNHFSFLEVRNKLSAYIMTSGEFARKFSRRRYDYVYIDGDHSYKGVKRDFELFWPKLASGGLMVFHDIDRLGLAKDINFGVAKFWQEIKIRYKSRLEFPNKASGLGILQKE